MKTIFPLEEQENKSKPRHGGKAVIISLKGRKPYVNIKVLDADSNGKNDNRYFFIPDKDLERFAVNILKALGSKKMKQPTRHKTLFNK